MFRKIEDFLKGWEYESQATLKVFGNLTDNSLKQKVTEDGRSLGFLAWHITVTLYEMPLKAGLPVEEFDESAPAPATVTQIKEIYEKGAKNLSELIGKLWNDEMLEDELNMYGQPWKRKDVLSSLIAHQAHHRGQMTVLMRQAGLKVPGVYGPAKEEWAMFGMPTQE